MRSLQARLQVPQRLRGIVRTEEQGFADDSICRFCWTGADDEEGGELLAPCRCTGTVKYIHRRCLGNWQRTQRSQGAFRKSYRCDICKQRYRVRRAPFSGTKIPLGGRLPTFDEFKEVFFSLLGSPVWQVGIDVWKGVILANGLIHASAFGVIGLEKGVWLAAQSAAVYFNLVKKYGIELLIAAAAFPIAQLPILYLTVGSGVAVGAEMLASVLVGWYAGAMYGFTFGAMQILQTTVGLAMNMGGKGIGCVLAGAGIGMKGLVGLLVHMCKGAVCAVR